MAAHQILDAVIHTPVGPLGIQMRKHAWIRIISLSRPQRVLDSDTGAVSGVLRALRACFDDPLLTPALPVRIFGTPYQHRVWQKLRSIPFSKIITYGALAERPGSSPRALGHACRGNPVRVVVVCHRDVACQGLGGFAGDGGGPLVAIKQWLLQHEGVEIPERHPHNSAGCINDQLQPRLIIGREMSYQL